MTAAIDKGYMHKSSRQRKRREVAEIWEDRDNFALDTQEELLNGQYHVGKYRHFQLRDKKKVRDISVLPFKDRCVQNDIKDAFEPLILQYMTDDMMGGLPGRGILAKDSRHCVVEQIRQAMNDMSMKYVMQGDISKFYDNVDKVNSIRLIEKKITDRRTLTVIREHLFNQKKLAIGDPFSHLIANMNMAVIIHKAKQKFGDSIRLVNFADNFIAFAKDEETLKSLRSDMRKWAKEGRLHYKCMYIQPIDAKSGKQKQLITFCGYQFGRGVVKLTQDTKKRYIKARHKKRSMGSYNGILQVADTKNLRKLIELNDNRHMSDKIRRPFAGAKKKVEMLEGITHTIVAIEEKNSWQHGTGNYMHVQAIADNLGLIVYTTSSRQMVKYLKENTVPMRDMKIVHDYSGYYYEGTVYTDAEEEAMLRKQFNIPIK